MRGMGLTKWGLETEELSAGRRRTVAGACAQG